MVNKHKAHPWHGISPGEKCPEIVTAFIEIVPSDTIKYEVDKASGYLKIDRPQKFSNVVPALYGFIPQTYCGKKVADYAAKMSGTASLTGDGDPLDICVFAERNIMHGDIILPAIPIGGFRMIDNGQADDKIIAVLANDEIYNEWKDIEHCPDAIIQRLKHYFLTYKSMPGENRPVNISHTYNKAEAQEVIRRSCEDYRIEIAEKNQ